MCVCRENAEFDEDGGAGGGGAADEAMSGGGSSSAKSAATLSPDIQIANIFYEAEDIRREEPREALQKFQQVVALANKAKADGVALNEESKTNQFNSIVHIVCLLYTLNKSVQANRRARGNPADCSTVFRDALQPLTRSSLCVPRFSLSSSGGASASAGLAEMVTQYKLLLDFIPHVTRNESSDAIDRVLSVIASSKDFNFLLTMYDLTLSRLKSMGDTERMRFNVQMKLCKTYLEKEDMDKGQEVRQSDAEACDARRSISLFLCSPSPCLPPVLRFAWQVLGQLLASCQTASGQDDKKNKGSELLEIYALQIQISSKRGDSLKMKELYDKTKDLTAAVKDPRSQSVIRESVEKNERLILRVVAVLAV